MTKIIRKLTRSEIQWGMLIYSQKTKNEFYDKLPTIFDIVCDSTRVQYRQVGKRKIWVSVDLMRKFKIGQILELEIKNKELHITYNPDQDPDSMSEFKINQS